MTRLLPLLFVGVAVVVALVSCVVAAKEGGPTIAPAAGPPVGEWKVEFANGVTELCDVFTLMARDMLPSRSRTQVPR